MAVRAFIAAAFLGSAVCAGDMFVYSHRPNTVSFPPQQARFVRFVIPAGSTPSEPCIDELEVYGPNGGENLALAGRGARASASSCLPGYTQHAIEHLNDGKYGNDFSWIAATAGEEWAQIELPRPSLVGAVVFSRDRLRAYGDRMPAVFEIRLSLDGAQWTTVRAISGKPISGAGSAAMPPLPEPPPPPRIGPDGSIFAEAGGTPHAVPRWDEAGFPNLALAPDAKAAASSVYAQGRLPIHQIAHLNDGVAGNSNSWISAGEPSWAEIDLGRVYCVAAVALGNDESGRYRDRAAATFAILASTEYDRDSAAPVWHVIERRTGGPALLERTVFRFEPIQARWIRVAVDATHGGEVRIDEIEVYGGVAPVAHDSIAALLQNPGTNAAAAPPGAARLLGQAFLGEEHAWLKTFGRADLDPNLVPYNGRVKEYPRHVGDDVLPLPPISTRPRLDGDLDDAAWDECSRGVARIACPRDIESGPLVEYEIFAGWSGDELYLALRTERLLSSHAAVIASGSGEGTGILAVSADGLFFTPYAPDGKALERRSVDGRFRLTPFAAEGARDKAGVAPRFSGELSLPLSLFPGCREHGLRIGLGLGGTHTRAAGRTIEFFFSPLSISQSAPLEPGNFTVRVAVPEAARAAFADSRVRVTGNVAALERGLELGPGESRTLSIPPARGPIGSEFDLTIGDDGGNSYALHLFRYDPASRALSNFEALIERLERKGIDVARERDECSKLRQEHRAATAGDRAAQRRAFLEARLAQRRLFFRDPDLAPLEDILFVKRQPFEPSHIYTDYTDAPFRGGGGICTLHIPRENGRLEPEAARVVRLFDAGNGIARDPAATFDRAKIFFGYRPAENDFYHLMCMKADGSGLAQLTSGPFHDFYPCPLPDGNIAFISTRCTSRVFCFRGASSLLFRLDFATGALRPLSYSSLSEWAPSVMSDGRIIWTRWEYIDKGADFSQTLWSIRPDGTDPEIVFGNTIIQPNGYACGREVPGTSEICCTLVSHFGDINGPLALVDLREGRFNPKAIRSVTPEVPWPGMWPRTECFRDPVPVARDYFLCSHAPSDRFGLFVVDRFGNRELLHMDPAISSMGPTLFRAVTPPPVLPDTTVAEAEEGLFVLVDVNQGISPPVPRGAVKYVRVVEEVRHDIRDAPNRDHADFMKWYASPVDVVSGPYGWPCYVAKASLGLVRVEADGSAYFRAPAGRTLYFQALDENFNELQRMRSMVQLQGGESRSCIGCHEDRYRAPQARRPLALGREPQRIMPPSFGDEPFSFTKVVQPVLDKHCIRCHDGKRPDGFDLTGTLDRERIPASYRTIISQGWVHYLDCGWNSGGCEKREPLTFGTLASKLWTVLDRGHHDVSLDTDEKLRIKTWTDLNCPLWPDYIERSRRPTLAAARPQDE
jgi:hypothetical protein